MKLHESVTNKKTIGVFKNIGLRFKNIHGDKYDYSESIFIKTNEKMKIICSEHGVFEQTPSNHLAGHGCSRCVGRLKNNDVIKNEMTLIHKGKYDYSLVEYNNATSVIKIICPEHGVFEQTPDTHLRGGGCIKCAGVYKKDNETFIKEAISIHNKKYNYSLTEYKNALTKVKIICPEHGVFEQTPNGHLHGYGCARCGGVANALKSAKTTIQFISEANTIHDNKYIYSDVNYVNALTKVKITCKQHGIFEQTPNSHLNCNGCPICAKNKTNYQKYKGKKTTLYYIKINNYYKIGLTKSTVHTRFKKEMENGVDLQIIKTIEYEDGWTAFKKEQQILKETIHLNVTKEESPICIGWTEVRKCDISEFFPE